MRRRLVIMIALGALLIIAAAPAIAAPGGVPGPSDHVVAMSDTGDDTVDEGDGMAGPPEHAKAYGWRIKNEFEMPYGHIVRCMKASDTSDVDDLDVDDSDMNDFDMAMCEGLPDFGDGDGAGPMNPGAKAYWEFWEFWEMNNGQTAS